MTRVISNSGILEWGRHIHPLQACAYCSSFDIWHDVWLGALNMQLLPAAACFLQPCFFFFLRPIAFFCSWWLSLLPMAFAVYLVAFTCWSALVFLLLALAYTSWLSLYFGGFSWLLLLLFVCLLLSLTFSCSLWLFLALCDFPCSLWLFLAAVALLLPFFVIAIYQQMWFKGSLMFIHVSNMGWPPNFFAWDGCLFALAKKKKNTISPNVHCCNNTRYWYLGFKLCCFGLVRITNDLIIIDLCIIWCDRCLEAYLAVNVIGVIHISYFHRPQQTALVTRNMCVTYESSYLLSL